MLINTRNYLTVTGIVLKRFLSRLFSILTPKERFRLFIMAAADLLMGVADVVFLVVLLLIINSHTRNMSATPSIHYGWLNQLLTKADVVMVTAVFLVLFCIKNIIAVRLSKNQYHFVYGVASRLSEKNITDYLQGDYRQYVSIDSSVHIKQISQVPIEFGHYVLTNFQQIIAQGVLILFTVGGILWYSPLLFILLLLLLLPPVMLLGWFIKHQLGRVRAQIKTNSIQVIQYLQEALAGYVESNLYQSNRFLAGRYYNQQQQMNHHLATQQHLQGLSSRFMEIFVIAGFFILILINRWLGSSTAIDLFMVSVFITAAYKIIPGAVKIMNSLGQIKTYRFTMDSLAGETAAPIATNTISSTQISSIRFDRVGFKYKEHQLLNGFNAEINPDDFVGISGISGSGKTTLINLLLGFLEQDKGDIIFNNQVCNAGGRRSFWPRIAYVKQQGYFINDTLLKNILLSDEQPDEQRLNNALSISGLDAFLSDEPEQVQKMIDEHGKNISGGQRQRIMLARALYSNSDLLILDEPFSEMDSAAEQAILCRLKKLSDAGAMIILITHNIGTLSVCNKIWSPYAV